MAASAPARRARPARRAAPARRATPARPKTTRPATRRARSAAGASRARTRPRHTPPAGLVPVAVGRTAGAVSGLADSGVVLRLTRGRLWIAALATLLVGIVALNVLALGLSASSSKLGRQADGLTRENAALRSKLIGNESSEKVAGDAARLGLVVPEAGAITYLRPGPGDPQRAAERLRSGELTGTAQ
jgi:hypothetical protein